MSQVPLATGSALNQNLRELSPMEMVRIINSRTELIFPKREVIFLKFAARYLTMQTDYPYIVRLFLFANSVNAHGIYTGPRPDELPERLSALLFAAFFSPSSSRSEKRAINASRTCSP
ncbi:hypothetical protein CAM18_06825 [Salmonella enterica]|nr:hypothetical protein [Salmonella enterica]EBV6705849.1 hypothetical protein [Salmonella enterica subsp. enterica serovar Anatum]ECS8313111.1 hypothetical protein [Salmonella enterica subsp. enterica serovar Panama]ECT7811697.1 hypothetical protein [Salmonella enterica subsp. enterica serovar 9,12:-:1,5]EBK3046051.1 hypothetical protein [Salmonella enterica]